MELLKDTDHTKPQKSLSLAKYLHLKLPPQEMLSHTQITVVVASVLVLWSIRGVLVDTIYDTTIRYRGMHKLSYQRALDDNPSQAAAHTLSTKKPLHSASNINKCSYSLKATNHKPKK